MVDPSGERLLGWADGQLHQWRPQSGAGRALPTRVQDVTTLAYDSSGGRFAFGTRDGQVGVVLDPVPATAPELRGWVERAVVQRSAAGAAD